MKDDLVMNQLTRIPLSGTFELTARCNLRCKMCLVRLDPGRMAELGGRERTAAEWIDMASQVKRAGTLRLLLTGGEPMLREDFSEIYEAIAGMGFYLTLYTNASMLNEEIFGLLRRLPPHKLGVTIYGASAETYKNVSGDANAYEKTIKGIKRLSELPSEIDLRTTIIKDNLSDFDAILKLGAALNKGKKMDVSRIVTMPVRGAQADAAGCRLSPEENVALHFHEVKYLYEKLQPLGKWQEFAEYFIAKDKQQASAKRVRERSKPYLYGCEAGVDSYCISWDGRLLGCQLLDGAWTLPFETGFEQAWNDFPNQVRLPKPDETCVRCEMSGNCAACPATRLAETGSLTGPVDYFCREAFSIQPFSLREKPGK